MEHLMNLELEGNFITYISFDETKEAEWLQRMFIISEDRILPHGAKYRAITIWDIFQEFVKYTILGWIRVPFPENIPNEAFALYENEYTDAIIEIIHAHLFRREEYGDYQIYIGNYGVNTDIKDRNKGYNICITVAIVPLDKGIEYGKWWVFRAKDTLDKNGKVIVESDGGAQYQFPARYDNFELAPHIYGPRIEGIVDAERLILPLRVDESDEVKELGTSMDEDDVNTVRYYLKN